MEAIVPANRPIPPGPARDRIASIAAAAGTSSPGLCVLPSAAGTSPASATTTSVSALPQVQPVGEPVAGGQGNGGGGTRRGEGI